MHQIVCSYFEKRKDMGISVMQAFKLLMEMQTNSFCFASFLAGSAGYQDHLLLTLPLSNILDP